MQTIKAVILNVLSGFPVEFNEATVAELERKVLLHHPEKPSGFAYVTTKNWAIDQVRRRATEAKKKARTLLAAEKDQIARERFERCKREFDDIVFVLAPNLWPAQQKQVEIVRLTCFEGLRDDDCARLFPGTNKNQRYQWKCRGIRLLLSWASPELKEFLCKPPGRKPSPHQWRAHDNLTSVGMQRVGGLRVEVDRSANGLWSSRVP